MLLMNSGFRLALQAGFFPELCRRLWFYLFRPEIVSAREGKQGQYKSFLRLIFRFIISKLLVSKQKSLFLIFQKDAG